MIVQQGLYGLFRLFDDSTTRFYMDCLGWFDDSTTRFYMGCVVSALDYLHSRGIFNYLLRFSQNKSSY